MNSIASKLTTPDDAAANGELKSGNCCTSALSRRFVRRNLRPAIQPWGNLSTERARAP